MGNNINYGGFSHINFTHVHSSYMLINIVKFPCLEGYPEITVEWKVCFDVSS